MSGLKFFVMLSIFLALISCSKPVEVMNVDLLFTIDGSFEPKTTADYDKKFTVISDVEVDKEGNIYLFNPRMERIMKYDKDGSFIKYFGNRGTLKGDMMNAIDFTIMRDTIYIKNNFTPLILRYSLDGEFIDHIYYTNGKLQFGEIIRSLSDSKVIDYFSGAEQQDDVIILSNNLTIMNDKFEVESTLREYSAEMDKEHPKFFEFISKYAFGDGKVYVAANDEKTYRIDIFDYEGNIINEISEDYKRTEYNNYELERIKEMPIYLRKSKIEKDTLETEVLYKKSVNDIFCDKYGRFLVCPSIERDSKNQNDFIVDIFDNDKFVKRAVIPQLKGEDFLYKLDSQVYFIGDRIYEVLHKEMKVNVYGY